MQRKQIENLVDQAGDIGKKQAWFQRREVMRAVELTEKACCESVLTEDRGQAPGHVPGQARLSPAEYMAQAKILRDLARVFAPNPNVVRWTMDAYQVAQMIQQWAGIAEANAKSSSGAIDTSLHSDVKAD